MSNKSSFFEDIAKASAASAVIGTVIDREEQRRNGYEPKTDFVEDVTTRGVKIFFRTIIVLAVVVVSLILLAVAANFLTPS